MNLQVIRTRAAARLAALHAPASNPAPPANPANWLTPAPRISQLATLATHENARASPEAEASDADAVLAGRRDRLLRWGWAQADADALASRLARRDYEEDNRVTCTDCQHYRPGRSSNHRRAGLYAPDVGRDLAGTLQRCPGFETAR